MTTKGTMYARDGKWEIWIIPEANGYRVRTFIRKGGALSKNRTMTSDWVKTKVGAISKARGLKRKYQM